MGKGSRPRPLSVPRKTYEEAYDTIFSKRKKESTKLASNSTKETSDK